MRSNMFANIENKFQGASEDEIIGTALASLNDMISELSSFDGKAKFIIAIIGAKLGVSGDGEINDKEKMLLNTVFENIWNGPMDDIYKLVDSPIEEKDYELVQQLTQLGNDVVMPFLYYILSFAYIDGVFEDNVAEKLDGLFGMNLLADFFESGLEEVPAPGIKLTGLEAEIAEWFQSDDELRKFEDIQSHFPCESAEDLKDALDSLCDKGVLYNVDSFVGSMYGLA